MKAILVTGSRDWKNESAIATRLWGAAATEPIRRGAEADIVLIHGDCHLGGADLIAHEVAKAWGWSTVRMPAQWKRDGRQQAGTERNQRMLRVLHELRRCGYDCEVHAFPLPQSRGTRHMMAIAQAAGFAVHDHGRSE